MPTPSFWESIFSFTPSPVWFQVSSYLTFSSAFSFSLLSFLSCLLLVASNFPFFLLNAIFHSLYDISWTSLSPLVGELWSVSLLLGCGFFPLFRLLHDSKDNYTHIWDVEHCFHYLLALIDWCFLFSHAYLDVYIFLIFSDVTLALNACNHLNQTFKQCCFLFCLSPWYRGLLRLISYSSPLGPISPLSLHV